MQCSHAHAVLWSCLKVRTDTVIMALRYAYSLVRIDVSEVKMKYISDEKNGQESQSIQGDDMVTRSLASLARRTDRRRCHVCATVLLCVIFALCCAVGGLLYVYALKTNAIPSVRPDDAGVSAHLRILFKRFAVAFLPILLAFVCGYRRSASLVCGVNCAFTGIFCGAYGTYAYGHAHVADFLSDVICCGVYGFLVIHFCAVAVSFSHLVRSSPPRTDKAFDEDIVCYLDYFAATGACVLALCAVNYIIQSL